MANKNKNIKALVSEGCNAESPALELIPTLTQPVQYPFARSEAQEKTREFRDLVSNNVHVTSDELTSSRFDHAKRIEELEFDLEQSQVRQRGLEKELEVRILLLGDSLQIVFEAELESTTWNHQGYGRKGCRL